MIKLKVFAAFLLFIQATACAAMGRNDAPDLQTVPYVDITRYLGTWFEIASYPQRFQKNCVYTKATYSLRDDGRIKVVNECREKTSDGKIRSIEGKAWVVDAKTNAKLKVQFFWPFSGDYWIIDVGSDYEYAVVGHPNRTYLWILSRTPQMDETTYQNILARLTSVHAYDLAPLQKTLQP